MNTSSKVVNTKPRQFTPRFRDVSTLRCEQCRKVLLIDEASHCRLCAGLIAVYGKAVA